MKIEFIDRMFQQGYGAGIKEIDDDTALKLLKKGVARTPIFNTNFNLFPNYDISKWITKIAWVGKEIDNNFAKNCGFDIVLVNLDNIEIIFKTDILVICDDIPSELLYPLKIVCFHYKIPFIFLFKIEQNETLFSPFADLSVGYKIKTKPINASNFCELLRIFNKYKKEKVSCGFVQQNN